MFGTLLFIQLTAINFIYRIIFICKLVKFNTIYKNINMFYPGKCGLPSKVSVNCHKADLSLTLLKT